MEKIIALILTVLMLISGTAFAEGGLLGGWTDTENPAVTEELQAIFDEALEGLLGVSYTPVACLGTQAVAGTNYAFLAKAQVVYPNAQPYYAVVFVNVDPEGQASLMNIADFDYAALCAYGGEGADYSVATSFDAGTVEAFAADIRTAMLNGEWDVLSEMISYPIDVNHETTVNSAEEFLAYMENKALTEEAVASLEDEDCAFLFANYQGVSMADGHIWFAEIVREDDTSELKIIALTGIEG